MNLITPHDRLVQWFQHSALPRPWRQLWQMTRDPYPVWVSEIMLQQTVIAAVIPKYIAFMTALPTIQHLAQADEEQLRPLVSGLGYYRRFHHMLRAAQQLVRTDGSVVWPQKYEEWLELPGIGPYTAAAVSSIVQENAKLALDGNAERVIARWFGLAGQGIELKSKVLKVSSTMAPQVSPGDFNQALMEIGQRFCRPLRPRCAECPLTVDCRSFATQDFQPIRLKPVIAKTELHLRLRIYRCGEHYVLQRRPLAARFLRNQWGLSTELQENQVFKGDGFTSIADSFYEIGKFSHNITRYKLTVQVVVSKWTPVVSDLIKLVTEEELASKLVASLDQKAWRLYQAWRDNHS